MMADGQGPPPALWSAEEPHLYYLLLTLRAKDGSIIECESCQVSSLLLAPIKYMIYEESLGLAENSPAQARTYLPDDLL